MTVEEIIENYKKKCTGLEPIKNIFPRDYQSINYLAELSTKGEISDDEIISAFERANKSEFLCGRKNKFRATILWITNPVNIEKINLGNYDDKETKKGQARLNTSWNTEREKELEREQHEKNMKKLEKYREEEKNDKKYQEWLENYWYKKYPNLRGFVE